MLDAAERRLEITLPLPLPLTSPPPDELALRWVYGFRGFDTRCGALWASPSTLVYPAAAVVVVHDVVRDTQRHFRQHEDDVLCVATAWCRGLGLGLGLG